MQQMQRARLLILGSLIFRHVDDIDLYVGGLSEKPVAEGTLGPTFACLFAFQFGELRKGDRFWFENPNQFTPGEK